MIVSETNPEWLDPDAYVAFLNQGFPGQWDRASFEWYLRRQFNGRPTDIAVRAAGKKILAGVSYCYRQIQQGSNEPIGVCVMSAGTTLPAERGRGHYRALLETSIELCKRNSCAAILGFVTRANASGRGLARLGAYAIPSYYIASREGVMAPRRTSRKPPRLMETADVAGLRGGEEPSDGVRFHYAQHRDWVQQFLCRPGPVCALRISHDSVALIERVGTTDRLQWLSCPATKTAANIAILAASSAAAGRQFFLYTLDPLLARTAARLGLRIRGGYLMMLALDRRAACFEELAHGSWHVQSGDRM